MNIEEFKFELGDVVEHVGVSCEPPSKESKYLWNNRTLYRYVIIRKVWEMTFNDCQHRRYDVRGIGEDGSMVRDLIRMDEDELRPSKPFKQIEPGGLP